MAFEGEGVTTRPCAGSVTSSRAGGVREGGGAASVGGAPELYSTAYAVTAHGSASAARRRR